VLYDISPLIDESIAVWPGDTPYAARDVLKIDDGESVNLSTLTLSCHTGAHADATNHYLADGEGIDRVRLDRYLGPCWLVDAQTEDGAIGPSAVDGVDFSSTPRVLFRTGCIADRTVFPDRVAYLAPELVDHLAKRRVVLVGLDSPSVDPFDSKDLPAHKALARHGIANLECLALKGVPAGRYELIALPLRLKARDASPVRAVLRTL
jgi:arylformamidase